VTVAGTAATMVQTTMAPREVDPHIEDEVRILTAASRPKSHATMMRKMLTRTMIDTTTGTAIGIETTTQSQGVTKRGTTMTSAMVTVTGIETERRMMTANDQEIETTLDARRATMTTSAKRKALLTPLINSKSLINLRRSKTPKKTSQKGLRRPIKNLNLQPRLRKPPVILAAVTERSLL
jgi:hypothetical protein